MLIVYFSLVENWILKFLSPMVCTKILRESSCSYLLIFCLCYCYPLRVRSLVIIFLRLTFPESFKRWKHCNWKSLAIKELLGHYTTLSCIGSMRESFHTYLEACVWINFYRITLSCAFLSFNFIIKLKREKVYVEPWTTYRGTKVDDREMICCYIHRFLSF